MVGSHEGVHRFTVGQRKGLGVALGTPAFVTRIDPERATVHLGREDALRARGATLADVVLADGVVAPRASARARAIPPRRGFGARARRRATARAS